MIIHHVHRQNVEVIWPLAFVHLKNSFPHSADPDEQRYFPGLLKTDPSTMLLLFMPGPTKAAEVLGAAIVQDIGTSLHVRQLAGQLPENWAAIFDAWLVNMARVIARSRVTSQGRPGWKRKLAPLGWKCENGLLIREV